MRIHFLDGSIKSFDSLWDADLRYADLRNADLQDADLRHADLRDTNLQHANLQCANLRYASLRDADLRDADLQDADLRQVNLQDADLRGARVEKVKWPSPPMVLLAFWGRISDNLTQLLMKYDMRNHPEPEKFKIWKDTGDCPYSHNSVQRSANFKEVRNLFDPDVQLLSAYELMQMLLKECCVG